MTNEERRLMEKHKLMEMELKKRQARAAAEKADEEKRKMKEALEAKKKMERVAAASGNWNKKDMKNKSKGWSKRDMACLVALNYTHGLPRDNDDDAWDYYEKCSTKGMLDKVSVPQFVIQAKDDPFFQGQENPSNNIRRPFRIHYTENGGHCGYVFHSVREGSYKTSWMPSELARFVSHIEENFKT